MTYESTKKLLQSFSKLKVKLHILQNYLKTTHSPQAYIIEDYNKINFLTDSIEACFTILSEEENFIIDQHIIKHYTWKEVEQLYEKRWGKTNGRSERTLKRMQKNALKKITMYINEFSLEQYIS